MSNTLNSNDLPLASRLRPQSLAEFIGQSHLLGAWRLFSKMLEAKKLHSMILWGPPGVGKTTLANLLIRELNSETSKFNFQILSAINSGVKEIRALREKNTDQTKKMVLFIDEIHRFSKTQQDALLPLIESGEIYLIGATTENPSFELNKALLSRCRVHVLKPLSQEELKLILNQALLNKKNGFGNLDIDFSELEKDKLVVLARGDARNLLNLLEIILEELVAPDPKTKIYTIVMENLYKNLFFQ